jgi:hypothetical protein
VVFLVLCPLPIFLFLSRFSEKKKRANYTLKPKTNRTTFLTIQVSFSGTEIYPQKFICFLFFIIFYSLFKLLFLYVYSSILAILYFLQTFKLFGEMVFGIVFVFISSLRSLLFFDLICILFCFVVSVFVFFSFKFEKIVFKTTRKKQIQNKAKQSKKR